MKNNILLGHGSGGKLSHDLIDNIFMKYFGNPELSPQTDSALLSIEKSNLAFTTDSFVVDPIFFLGGNIGKLAIAGTVNDLAVAGATPLYLSSSFIIEEGFAIDDLIEIVKTMAEEAQKAGIKIVTGDTKVVDKGKCDKVFINTSGIGVLDKNQKKISSGKDIKPGDKIIINGTIADHGMAIISARNDLKITSDVQSDCACLNKMIKKVLDVSDEIKFMRDATRGGVATVLSELVNNKNYGINVDESSLKINESVRGICEMLGFDPMYVANEGKVVIIAGKDDAEKIIKTLQKDESGKNSTIIGEITESHPGKGWITTEIGGKRIIDMLSGEQLPRIC